MPAVRHIEQYRVDTYNILNILFTTVAYYFFCTHRDGAWKWINDQLIFIATEFIRSIRFLRYIFTKCYCLCLKRSLFPCK